MKGIVALVGAGPGDPGLLTVKAARLISEAEVLVYDALASDPIVALARDDCERIYVGKRARNHTMPQAEISALLVERAKAGRRVVRLKGGDPFVFGRGGEEAQELYAAGIPFEIVPGISSALAAPAYAGIPITHRQYNTNFTVATGHEDPTKGMSTLDWSRLADGSGTSVFLMAMGNLAGIMDALRQHGRAGTTPVAIISDGTTPRQRTVVATLDTIVAEVRLVGISAPAVVVVGEAIAVREQVRWFDRQPLFGHRILITRPQPEAHELGNALWEHGAEPIYAPTVRRTHPSNPDDYQQIADTIVAKGCKAYQWIVLTSRYGVGVLMEQLHQRGCDTRALGGIRIAAIGPGTAQALRGFGIQAELVPEDHRSEGLATALEAALAQHQPCSVLVWAAEDGRDHVRSVLIAAGHHVTVTAAYRTVNDHPEDLAAMSAKASVWTFTSGSAIEGLLAGVPDAIELARTKLIVCLGPTTSHSAQAHGLQVDGTAEVATVAGLIKVLQTVCSTGERNFSTSL